MYRWESLGQVGILQLLTALPTLVCMNGQKYTFQGDFLAYLAQELGFLEVGLHLYGHQGFTMSCLMLSAVS